MSTMYTGMDMNTGDRTDNMTMNDDDIGTASLSVADAVTNSEMRDAGQSSVAVSEMRDRI